MKKQNKVILGISYMMISILLSSFFMVLVKWMSLTYDIIEIIFFRNFFALFVCLPLILKKKKNKFSTKNIKYHFLHVIFGLLAMYLYFNSIALLPLAQATAIFFSVPLFVTIFSHIVLKEVVNVGCWIAVIIGFFGALIVINPAAMGVSKGEIIAIITSIVTALALITVSYVSKKEGSITTTFYYTVLSAITLSFIFPFFWRMPTGLNLLVLIIIGIGSGIEQLIMTLSYKLCPAPIVAPVGYTSLIWAAIFGYVFWGERLQANVIYGSLIIMICTLYIYRVERNRDSQLIASSDI